MTIPASVRDTIKGRVGRLTHDECREIINAVVGAMSAAGRRDSATLTDLLDGALDGVWAIKDKLREYDLLPE